MADKADKSYIRRKAERGHLEAKHPFAKVPMYVAGGVATAVTVGKPAIDFAAWATQKMAELMQHVPWEWAPEAGLGAAAIYAGAATLGALREARLGPGKVAERSTELRSGASISAPRAFVTVHNRNKRTRDDRRTSSPRYLKAAQSTLRPPLPKPTNLPRLRLQRREPASQERPQGRAQGGNGR